MFCPKCGSSCEEGAKFCPICGKSLAVEQPIVEESNKLEKFEESDVETNPIYENPVSERKSIAAFILGIAAVVINSGMGCMCGCLGGLPGIVCAVIGLILGFKDKNNRTPGEKNTLNDIGIILCFVALGIMLLSTIINAFIGGINGFINASNY